MIGILLSILLLQDASMMNSPLAPRMNFYSVPSQSRAERSGMFFHEIEKFDDDVIMTYWYDFSPWIDEARTAWWGVNHGWASSGIDHVVFQVQGRGSVRLDRPRWNKYRNAAGYWIGFTGSRQHASNVYGFPVMNLIEIRDNEVLEVQAVAVSKSGSKAISLKPLRIGVKGLNPNPMFPWTYTFD